MRSRDFPFEIIWIFFASGFFIHRLEHEVFEGMVMLHVAQIALVFLVLLYLISVIYWNRNPFLYLSVVKLRWLATILNLPEAACQILS